MPEPFEIVDPVESFVQAREEVVSADVENGTTGHQTSSLSVLRWAILSLGFLAATLYATGAFTPSPDEPSRSESAALVSPDNAQRDTRPGLPIHAIDPFAPSLQEAAPSATHQTPPLQEAAPSATHQTQPVTSQPSETQPPLLSNDLAASSSVLPSDSPQQHSWGKLLRGTPVHSSPSVSSDILGYATTGAEMQLLERNLGWVRILDPATSREGWIYEEHITVTVGPSTLEQVGRQEAALETDGDPGELEQPKRSFKAKKSRKNYAKKRWRKPLRFVLRFRRF